jgi:hypothetical protein
LHLPIIASEKPFDWVARRAELLNLYVIKTTSAGATFAIAKNSIGVGFFVREYLAQVGAAAGFA